MMLVTVMMDNRFVCEAAESSCPKSGAGNYLGVNYFLLTLMYLSFGRVIAQTD